MRLPLVLTAALAACAHAPGPSGPSTDWEYEVRYSDEMLEVDAHFPPSGGDFVLDRREADHVSELSVTTADGRVMPAARRGAGWEVEGCAQTACRLRYRFDLGASGQAGAERPSSISSYFDGRVPGRVHTAAPARWLVRPERAPPSARFRFRVHVEGDDRFVTGVRPGPQPGTYEARASDLISAPYAVFGALTTRDYHPPGATVTLAYPRGAFTAGDDAIGRWAEGVIDGLAHYWGGRFPVPHAAVILIPTGDQGVYFGAARGMGGAAVQLLVGPATSAAALLEDWVLAHEMVHIGFPNLPRRQRWMEEGLATYLETIIRTRAGIRTDVVFWGELTRNLSEGLLEEGEGGYNETQTRSYAHMYWGGALFFLLADLEIRRRTDDARSLEDVMRALRAAGGTIEESWTPERVIAVADAATGVPVLAELWRDLAEGARPTVDLDGLFERLGVTRRPDGTVHLRDDAPWAARRRALTAPFEGASTVSRD